MVIELFGRQIPLYGVFFYIGVAVAACVSIFLVKKKKVPLFDLAASGIYTMIGAILGAKLLFLAVSMKTLIALHTVYGVPWSDVLLSAIKGGFVFYGGFIGGLLGLLIYIKQFRVSTESLFEIYAVVVPLGHAFGRVGCFFAGCCYGIPYDGWCSYTYTQSVGVTPLGVPLLPLQLIEAFCLFCLFVFLLIVFWKSNNIRYLCTKIYVGGYAVLRFALEFFRGDRERGGFLFLSTSQWISFLMIIFLVGVCLGEKIIKKRRSAAMSGEEIHI